MRRFEMLLETALNGLEGGIVPNDKKRAPLVPYLNELLAAGRIKMAQKSPQGFIFLQKLGLTQEDKQQLMKWGAWDMEASTNEWILDLRKVPGIRNVSQTGPVDNQTKIAVNKAAVAFDNRTIVPGDMVASSALAQLLRGSEADVLALRKLGVLEKLPEGGFTINAAKLKAARQQFRV